MRVYRGLSEFKTLKNAVVTNGTFDGVHLGHQKIFQRLREVADAHDGETVVLTFWPHPRVVLTPDNHNLQLLSTLDEKVEQLKNFGIDHLIIIEFTKEFSQTPSKEYLNILANTIGTQHLVIGYDHKFGKGREGSFEYLCQHAPEVGINVEEIPMHDIDNIGISSTLIRKSLLSGDVPTANAQLGRPYSISGKVNHGDQLGRKLGYPTANILIAEPLKLIPANGVYAVHVNGDGFQRNGMLNIGNRPTVDGSKESIEVHIFDFDRDIYDQELTISLVQKIRSEQKFPGLDELKAQLSNDKQQAIKILS